MPRAHTGPARHILALSVPDAAAAIGVSLNTLNEWVASGELPLVRLTTPAGTEMKRVLWRDLEAFAERHRDRPQIAGRRTA